MSIQIIKAGILDTVQDRGRYGYQHLGINPGGEMDIFSAQLSNCLLGKEMNAPVIEMHFPAAQIFFEEETVICITGGDFLPVINKNKIPVGQPVAINTNSILQFEKVISGATCYLSILQDLTLDKWLNSYSTNIKAEAGGWNGRKLKKGDRINFKNNVECTALLSNKDFILLPWGKRETEKTGLNKIRFIKGNEWDWLTNDAINIFKQNNFSISNNSDRMGYRLMGKELKTKENDSLLSSAVTFGTIQLLPDGQLIILMADHQTTGGYPRIANVISADLSLLAQKKPGDKINFSEADHKIAEQEIIKQHNYLQQLQTTCKFKMEKILNVTL